MGGALPSKQQIWEDMLTWRMRSRNTGFPAT
jgi:hypothetical protein